MSTILAIALMLTGGGLLVALSVIDLRVRLLPDRLVLPFALCGIAFHIVTLFAYGHLPDMMIGVALGGGLLYGIRFVANRLYGQDALGLGDVKLMAAAGIWLGEWVLMALCLGALLGMVHGLGVGLYESRRSGQKLNLNRLEVPAGPGFALGIAAIALYRFSFGG